MPLNSEFLETLCDPATKAKLKELPADMLAKINAAIEAGKVQDASGNAVEKTLDEGLITEDSKTVYRIDGGIPIMLSEQGIPTKQLPDLCQ